MIIIHNVFPALKDEDFCLASGRKAVCLQMRFTLRRGGNPLPSAVCFADRIKFMLVQMDQEIGDYFDTMSGRDGFDDMFSEAFDKFIAYILKADKPSEHGPRMPDGTWHEGITRSVRVIGEWIRTGASDALRSELSEREITHEGLADALRAGVATSPATAQNATSP